MGLVVSATAAAQTTGDAVKTQMLVTAPSNVPLRRVVASVDFAGIDPTGPQIKCELVAGVINDAGTGTALDPEIVNGNDNGTIRASGKMNYTGQPTWTSERILEIKYVHPQQGKTFLLRPDLKPGESLAIRTTPVSSSGPVCAPTLIWEEA
jgi:hypothetical protein